MPYRPRGLRADVILNTLFGSFPIAESATARDIDDMEPNELISAVM